MTPTPVGMRCPECSRQRTKVRTSAAIARGETPLATYVIIGICVALQLGEMASGANAAAGGLGGSSLIQNFALSGPSVADGEVYRLLTAGFLHSGLFHVLVNMFSLWVLGTMLEPGIGRLRFVLIYLVSLLAGSFGALIVTPHAVTVGASGAIFGLLGAGVVILRNRGIDPMQSGLPLWIGINLVFSFAVPGISIGGHIGGLIGGALAALVLFELPDRVRRLPAIAPMLAAGALGAAAVVGSLAVV
jgi:membrane associated rhomboid family serine protease